jgi:prevent-host-death family protein
MASAEELAGLETVNVHTAKTHLSRLLERVERGEEIVIARAGSPVARLVPIAPAAPRRAIRGSFRGRIRMTDDFDEPLPWQDFPGFSVE